MGRIAFSAGEDRPTTSVTSLQKGIAQSAVDDFMRQILSTQEAMRAPELFAAPRPRSFWRRLLSASQEAMSRDGAIPKEAIIFRRQRQAEPIGSGLVTIALRHGSLPLAQRRTIGVFRLHQYILCGWYDPSLILERRLATDRAMLELDELDQNAIHILVGTPDGRVLGYFCMEPATPMEWFSQNPDTEDFEKAIIKDTPNFTSEHTKHHALPQEEAQVLAASKRAVFPAEDLFGIKVFATLPRLAQTPVSQVRELSTLVRNQAVAPSSRLGLVAVVEAISAMAQLIMNPDIGLHAALGHIDLEARRLTAELGMPFLYAPAAPIAPLTFDTLWTTSVDEPDHFWPFVVAAEDLHTHAATFAQMESNLDGPINGILRALISLRRNPTHVMLPKALLPQPIEGVSSKGTSTTTQIVNGMLWTSDAFYGEDVPADASDA